MAQPLVEANVPFKIHIVKDQDMKERLCLEVERLGLSTVIMGSRGFGASRRSTKGRLGSDGALFGESVKRFNVNTVMGLDVDIRLLESFAENQAPLFTEADANQLKSALVESRQMINLLLSNHPENFLNPVIRERSYNALDYRKVVTISEKLRDRSDRLFGSFGTRGVKQNPKKKSLDTLIKRLKDVN